MSAELIAQLGRIVGPSQVLCPPEDLAAYEQFLMRKLTRIRGIASVKSSFALRSVKYRTDLPIT